MTEFVAQPCIRGCNRPCNDDQCRATGRHEHEPHPRPADVGLLCRRCADGLRTSLTDIPDLYATVCQIDVTERPPGQGSESKKTKISGSPALVNLTAMAIQDPNAYLGDGIIPVVAAMQSWADLFVEENHIRSSPTGHLWANVQLFTTWWTTLCRQPWIDEFYTEISDMHRMLSGAAHVPKSIGRCFGWVRNAPDCGQKLYPAADGSEVVCDKCGRRYSGLDLVRLELSKGA